MKTVLVTGSNRGIGLELAKHYLGAGWKVIATCRKASEELKSTNANIIENIDVSKEDSIESLSGQLENQKIDLLINNAGIWREENIANFSADTIREQFDTNTIAPLQVSVKLLPLLPKGGKIIFITSRMGSITDNNSGGRFGYRMSKAALNAGAKSLSIDIKADGISVGIIHPGYVKTDMTYQSGQLEPHESAELISKRIDEVSLENTGRFVHAKGEVLPW